MNASDLYALRERFNQDRTLLCFNGPISRSLIEEIGNALKNYLEIDQARPAEAMDVFSAYIEMTQNIRNYALEKGYGEADAAATVVIARDPEGRYTVTVGNRVELADGERLLRRVEELATMDKAQLKATYKTQLRQPRDPSAATGAGLGLIDLARRATAGIEATLSPHGDGRGFFSLSVVI
ncbi:biofilm regulation protein kinase SiaB [Bordetella sp. LUAb4]|uniref:biofilm regulation protein kinase SiaB n=1 Tax=Bordetella sp. LUAb4 TaxID=2843195 RepID=UPI001E3DB17B|nr:biofilm regulation protein kinase SiaB [Bordetella sp. LUAb4]